MHLLVLAAADGLPNQDVVGTAPRDAVDCRQVVPAVSGATGFWRPMKEKESCGSTADGTNAVI